jgi:hypothetical protein
MDLREIEWDGVDWIDLVQYRGRWRALVKTEMNLRVLQSILRIGRACGLRTELTLSAEIKEGHLYLYFFFHFTVAPNMPVLFTSVLT